MKQRRKMEISDWLNALALMVAGIFFGIAADAVVRLITSAGWLLAVIILLPFIALLLFEDILNKAMDRFFPSGIGPAHNLTPKGKSPWPRLLSLPVGVLIGAVLARSGLASALLDVLP